MKTRAPERIEFVPVTQRDHRFYEKKTNKEWLAVFHLTNAIRCQGRLTPERRDILLKVTSFFGIPHSRYQAEVRRAACDSSLKEIADHFEPDNESEWLVEGQFISPALQLPPPHPIYLAFADELVKIANEGIDHTKPRSPILNLIAPRTPAQTIVRTRDLMNDVLERANRIQRESSLANPDFITERNRHDREASPERQSGSVSESELSSMSTAGTSDDNMLSGDENQPESNENELQTDEKQEQTEEKTVKCEVDLESLKEEKCIVTEISSEEESSEYNVVKEDEEFVKKHYVSEDMCIDNVMENTRKRRASTSIDEQIFHEKVQIASTVSKLNTAEGTCQGTAVQTKEVNDVDECNILNSSSTVPSNQPLQYKNVYLASRKAAAVSSTQSNIALDVSAASTSNVSSAVPAPLQSKQVSHLAVSSKSPTPIPAMLRSKYAYDISASAVPASVSSTPVAILPPRTRLITDVAKSFSSKDTTVVAPPSQLKLTLDPSNSSSSTPVLNPIQKFITVTNTSTVSSSSEVLGTEGNNTIGKLGAPITSTTVLSAPNQSQPSSTTSPTKQKPKSVPITVKSREPIVIRSPNIQIKTTPTVTLGNQELKRVPMPGIASAAKVLVGPTKVGAISSKGGNVFVMSTSATSINRTGVPVVSKRLSVPVRAHLPHRQEISSSFQATKIIQGTSTNSKPVIVLQKGNPSQTSTQRGVTFTAATKELVNKVLMSKNVSTLSRPLVSVQKAATVLKPGTNIPFSTNQGNVIVLDLSQEHIGKNATLAEILQASGIITDNTTTTTATSTVSSANTASNVTSLQSSSNAASSIPEILVESSSNSSSVNVPVTSTEDVTAFNTNDVATTCVNTITSVQASSLKIKEVEAQEWKASSDTVNETEGESIEFLPFTLDGDSFVSVVTDDTDGDVELLRSINKCNEDIESVSDSSTVTDEETSDGEGSSDKATSDNSAVSDASSENYKSESDNDNDNDDNDNDKPSEPEVEQSATSCNIEILSSDMSADSFQMMQVDSIAEVPASETDEVLFIPEEGHDSSDVEMVDEVEPGSSSPDKSGSGDTKKTVDDVMSFVRSSTENTSFSVTTEEGSDNASASGVE